MLWISLLRTFFFSSRRRHTRFGCDWSSDVCSSDLESRHSSADNSDVRSKVAGERRQEGCIERALDAPEVLQAGRGLIHVRVELAEREGFEPSVPFRAHTLSKRARSAAPAPLLGDWDYIARGRDGQTGPFPSQRPRVIVSFTWNSTRNGAGWKRRSGRRNGRRKRGRFPSAP